jgi:Fur family transcriptional regulator, ferric uptake regulator
LEKLLALLQMICNNVGVQVSSIDQILKKNGLRLTKQRMAVLAAMSDQPQSVDELAAAISHQGYNLDLVTVYRTVSCFVELGIIRKTQFQDGVAKYEVQTNQNHHHHLVCNNCGLVEDIKVDEQSLLKKVKNQTTFQITDHLLEFFGICGKCQT